MSGAGGGSAAPLESRRTPGPAAPPTRVPAAASPGEADVVMETEQADEALDPASMTVAEIKAWLTDNEDEGAVWQLTQSKAKKADFVKYMRSVM